MTTTNEELNATAENTENTAGAASEAAVPVEAVEIPGTIAPVPAPAAPAEPTPEDRLEATLKRLEEQAALQTAIAKKRLFYSRLGAAFLGAAALAMVWLAGRVIPQVETTLENANSAMQTVEGVVRQLDAADIPAILENLDQTLSEGRESINDASKALQQVSDIDFKGLNQAILDLQKVLQNPLGSLVSGFRRS